MTDNPRAVSLISLDFVHKPLSVVGMMTAIRPSIAIIIVNFNAGNYLLECVQSVLNTYPEAEIFVSDNGSQDTSIFDLKAKIGADPRLKIIENGVNLGFSRGNNVALEQTNREYLLFLNPDCVVKSGTIERMQQVLEAYPKAGMAGCLIRNPDGTVQPTCVRSIPTPWNSLVRVLHLHKIFPRYKLFQGLDLAKQALPDEITEVQGISGAFMFVRRAALAQVGLLDENYFLYCEDVDWMMRFHQAGWQILFVPDVEITHAKGICSKKRPLRVLWYKHTGMVRFYRKFFRNKYPRVLMGLVYAAIWLRFSLLMLIQVFNFRSRT